MKCSLLLLFLICCLTIHAQKKGCAIVMIDSGQDCSIRGMSIPSNNVIWLSGSNGHVAKSTNGGKSFFWMIVPGYEKTDFRDIHAFDSLTAIIMGIDNPANILKTKDGGRSWELVFAKQQTGMFLDAIDFRNEREGICIGDPIPDSSGKKAFFVIRTQDAGETWTQEKSESLVRAKDGEAVFSASGTNIFMLKSKAFDYAFISGGLASNLYLIGWNGAPNKVFPLPILKGMESTGAFSMATDGGKAFYCVGGDYKEPELQKDNFVWTEDQGKSWQVSGKAPPSGYRSCIRIINGKKLIACGSNGVDICRGADNWKRISGIDFNVCMLTPDKKLVIFGSGKGRIGLLRF